MFGEYVRTMMAGLIPWLASQMAVIAFVPSSVGPVGSPIRVSKETTFFTEPLTESGEVDFVAALNQHYSAGVSHDENAAVILAPLCGKLNWWHAPEGSKEWLQEMQQQLGSDPQQMMPDLLPVNAFNIPENRWENCRIIPWQRAANRDVEAMLVRNEAALQLIHIALMRPGYYRPNFFLLQEGSLANVILPDVQGYRSVCRMLAARTMLAIEEKRFADARRDLIDLHKLARLTSRSPFVIQQLVSCAIHAVAVRSVEPAYVYAPQLPTAELEAYRTECRGLPAFHPMWESVHHGGRAITLELAHQMRRRGATAWVEMGEGSLISFPWLGSEINERISEFFLKRPIDWNQVVVDLNQEFDDWVSAVQEASLEDIQTAIIDVGKRRRQREGLANSQTIAALLWGSPTKLGHLVAMRMTRVLFSLFEHLGTSVRMRERAIALSVLRTSLLLRFRNTGVFPKDLGELVPEFLTAEEFAHVNATAQQIKYEAAVATFRLTIDELDTNYPPPRNP